VEQHLAGHLHQLPSGDHASKAIVETMRADEADHGAHAQALGASPMPAFVQNAMRNAAKVMTRTAYHI
jgi:3-demethoxyubiquinol 3-hydroxylase